MTRSFLPAVILGLAVGSAAVGQPPTPRFRPFNGVSPDQFYQSSVARAADQLTQDLVALKTDVVAAPIAPQARQALDNAMNRAAAAAATLAQTARATADRNRVGQALGGVDAAVAALQRAAAQTPNITPAVAVALSRVSAAHQSAAVAVAGGAQAGPDQGKRVVARLAETLDHQAEGLRLVAAEKLGMGFTPNADQTLRRFAAAARKLHKDLDANGDLTRARADLADVTARWAEVATVFVGIPDLHPHVRNQAARVDGTYRKLVASIGPATKPGVPVAPPPPAYTPVPVSTFAVGAAEGGGPRVRVFHDPKGPPVFDFFAYDSAFRGGVRVAVADINGDGVPDLVTVPGKGAAPAIVRVFDGRDMGLMVEFQGWDASWSGGLNVAAADLTADGRALVAVAPEVGGGPVARVFDLAAGKEVATITAFPAELRGGLRVAFADVNGDGRPELVAVNGPCPSPPLVRVFDLATQRAMSEWLGADPNWTGGLWVAGHGGMIATGTDAGGPGVVRVFERGQKVGEFAPFPPTYTGGVRVAVVDARQKGAVNVVCTAGAGPKGSPVRVFAGRTGRLVTEFPAFADFDGGAYVAGK